MTKLAAISIAAALIFSVLSLRSPEYFFRTQMGVLDHSVPIPFFIEYGNGVPGYRPSDRELAKMAIDAWSRESQGKLQFSEAADPDAALLRVEWVSPSQGRFGETERRYVDGKPGAVVSVISQIAEISRPLANRAAGDALLRDTVVYLTCVHEIGHAVGLSHTDRFDDVMYFFGHGGDILEYFLRYRRKLQTRADIASYSGLSYNDTAMLRRLYR